MKRILIFAAVGTAAVAIAIFAMVGRSSGDSAGSGTTTLTTRQVGGFGQVLTDASGMPLYVNDQETRGGMILCNGSCAVIWRPLTVENGSPTGDTAGGTLGVVTRSDGTRQATLDGKPLYTFYTDQAGRVTGDNLKDSFDGQDFTWHVVTVGSTSGSSGGAAPGMGSNGANGGGSYDNGGATNGGGTGGYRGY